MFYRKHLLNVFSKNHNFTSCIHDYEKQFSLLAGVDVQSGPPVAARKIARKLKIIVKKMEIYVTWGQTDYLIKVFLNVQRASVV